MGNNRLYAPPSPREGIQGPPGDAEDCSWGIIGVVFDYDATFKRRQGENGGKIGEFMAKQWKHGSRIRQWHGNKCCMRSHCIGEWVFSYEYGLQMEVCNTAGKFGGSAASYTSTFLEHLRHRIG